MCDYLLDAELWLIAAIQGELDDPKTIPCYEWPLWSHKNNGTGCHTSFPEFQRGMFKYKNLKMKQHFCEMEVTAVCAAILLVFKYIYLQMLSFLPKPEL